MGMNSNTTKLRVRKIKTVTNPIMKGLLNTIYVAGLAGTIVVAPNALQAFDLLVKQVDKDNKRSKRFGSYARNSGYYEVDDLGDGKYAIKLSTKGQAAAKNLLLEEYVIPKDSKWDGKWHILMFDIAEEHKYLRDVLRGKSLELGMLPLQNSVYVYPYKFDEFLNSLHAVYPEAMQYVLSLDATNIDGEDQLIERFHKQKII